MAANVSTISRGTKVHGRVSGAVDLEVQGFIDGDVTVGGDVTLEEHGLLGGNVHARRLVVRGAVKGDLVGEESVVLEDGARAVNSASSSPSLSMPTSVLSWGIALRSRPGMGLSGVRSSRPASSWPPLRQ